MIYVSHIQFSFLYSKLPIQLSKKGSETVNSVTDSYFPDWSYIQHFSTKMIKLLINENPCPHNLSHMTPTLQNLDQVIKQISMR